MTFLALTLKLVAYKLAISVQIMMSLAHRGEVRSSKDGTDSSVGDVCSSNQRFKALTS
jgi:hypothetical protein